MHALTLLICYANARKYGRQLENFDKIYEIITKKFGCGAKTDEEIEKIMYFCKIFPELDELDKERYEKYKNNKEIQDFGLHYTKLDIKDELVIKDYVKRGIKCLLTFDLNNLEWDNFCNYFTDISIKQEDKNLTLEILEKDTEKYSEIEGHAVILSDIDDEGNYICMNSWGKDWGNKGTFKAKKEYFKQAAIHPIYFYETDLLENEKKAWIKLNEEIKKYLNEMSFIRCPQCKRSARIENFEIVESCKLKCPYESRCVSDMSSDEETNLNYIIEQLLSYDFGTHMRHEMNFSLGFG